MSNCSSAHLANLRRQNRGFTLFEVLIAISLLALLSIMTVSAMRFGVIAWRKGDAALTPIQEVSFAQRFLRQSLSAAYPRMTGEGDRSVEFEGNGSEIRFVGPAPQAISPAARAFLSISVKESTRGASLVVSIRPELVNGSADDTAIEEQLIDGAKEFRFTYLAEGESNWRNEWMNQPRLPALIKIQGVFDSGSEVIWPDLVIATKIDVDASCRYDRLSKYCQGRR